MTETVTTLEETYNTIASMYKMSKTLPFRKYVEEYTLFKVLGDLRGLKVLNLACGEGHYTRQLKTHGAVKAVGVDISSCMVRLAERQEQANPIGCSYVCANAANIGVIDKFDVVTGVYYLCVADSRVMLEELAEIALKNLKRGGRFVGALQLDLANALDGLSKYGIYHEEKLSLNEGDCLTISFQNPNKSVFQIQTYYWNQVMYEDSLQAAGFKFVRWLGPYLDPCLPNEYPIDYWQDFIDAKGMAVIEAVRPN